MNPSVSRPIRWATVIGAGIAVTLALWQDPVLAYGVVESTAGTPLDAPYLPVALAAALGLALAARRRRPVNVARPRGARPVSTSRPPNRRRSRR
ncbi:hypothetical protein [Micromonospora sp. DT47]|uniref:hypothetical protein n=1 Tax=Micromonospora sp. DT47 TaxID=3393431 RepID=UPI003CEA4A69